MSGPTYSDSGYNNEGYEGELEDIVPDNLTTSPKPKGPGILKSVSIDREEVTICPPLELNLFSFHRNAVSIQNAYKAYGGAGSTPILKNFSMTVKQGTIYSLLGASGCGKTTLLSCVVGLKKLNSGDITVLGARPGSKESGVPGKRVGYMPQEIALFGEFTIRESLHFYGRLYSMTGSEIEENTNFLIEFLNLPTGGRLVKNLSGGQQRRVSFACSMIGNPELLILDEPTVGVDALLRQSIWDHLVKVCQNGKTTVIITTHYIEEARQSNTIGLMRNGKLLVEDSPANLLKQYKTSLLEDIVMQLCLKDSTTADPANIEGGYPEYQEGKLPGSGSYTKLTDDEDEESKAEPSDAETLKWRKLHRASVVAEIRNPKNSTLEDFKESCNRVYTLTIKNFLTFIRNILFLTFILFCPALQVIVVCLAIGANPKGMSFAVVNYELEKWNATSCSVVERGPGCPLSDDFKGLLSCKFLDFVNEEDLKIRNYETQEEAVEDVKNSKVWGILTFAENYTQSVKERGLFGAQADLDSIYGSQIGIQMDFTSKQIGIQIQTNFYYALNDMMRNISEECGIDPAKLDVPLNYGDPIYGSESITFRDFIAPNALLGLVFFFPLSSSGLNYIAEKRLGTLDRSMVAGVTSAEFILAYSLVQFAVLFIQISLAFAFLVIVFGIEVKGSFALAYSIALLVGTAGIVIGFILSAVCDQEIQAVLLAMGAFVPNLIVSGLIWPLEGMSVTLQYFAYLLPCTLACDSLRSIVSRGVGLSHPKVWPGFISTSVWIFIYLATLVIINKLKYKQ